MFSIKCPFYSKYDVDSISQVKNLLLDWIKTLKSKKIGQKSLELPITDKKQN